MRTLCDSAKFRSVMGRFATGVTILTYERDGYAAGMTANAFLSVSLSPQLVLVSARLQSRFCESVKEAGRFCINFLSEEQTKLSSHFGGKPDENLQVPMCYEHGIPYLRGSMAHVMVRTAAIHDAGDHKLYIAEVENVVEYEEARPLLFYRGKYQRIASECVL